MRRAVLMAFKPVESDIDKAAPPWILLAIAAVLMIALATGATWLLSGVSAVEMTADPEISGADMPLQDSSG